MKTTLSIQVNNNQIISLLKQLDYKDRMLILNSFKEDWIENFLGLHEPKQMTINEYNSELNKGLENYKEGKTIKHSDLKKEIETWK